MSRERPESKLIRKNGVNITELIANGGHVVWFAAKLAAEAFITSPQQFIVLGIPPFNQVTQMLGAVESQLKTTDTPEETLKCFIKILQAKPDLVELAGQLTTEYESYGGTAFQSSSSARGSPSGAGGSSSTGAGGTDTLKQRLHKALKDRLTVNARITKVVFIGPAGSGKSHLLAALVGEHPGEFRNSTPCAKRGIRAIAHHRALVGENSILKLLKPDEFESMIVKAVNENVEVTPRLVDFSGVEAITTATARSSLATPPRDFEELLEHLSEQNTATISHSLDGTHWMIFVDTGGQPRFHEVSRAFTRNAAVNLVVIKLTDELGDIPSDEYYKDGQMICKFGAYNLTNQQLITRLLDAAKSCLNTTRVCGQIPKHPACVLVGTHKDKESECNESCVAKNEKLTETLRPYEGVIYPRKARRSGRTEWIFPVNAKPPFTEDQERLLQDLRDHIMQHSQEKSPTVPLALAWYALEIRMEMLREKGQRVISLAQCREIAQALRFPSPDDQTGEDDLLLALEYFDELGLTTYIPDVLPEVLFIDPQLLLDMVSDLIASCCRLRADDGEYSLNICSAQESKEFTEYGVFTIPLLKQCFSTHYVEGLFTAQNFVDLLTYLLVASPLDHTHTRYFMPSLLQSSSTCIHSITPSHTCCLVPLQTCPLGLFCAVVSYMLSNPTKPHLSFYEKVGHLCQDCVTFAECNDYGCTVTLVNNDSSLCIEVYVNKSNLNDQELSELCPALRDKVLKGIQEASRKHHYEINPPKIDPPKTAFFCHSECPRKLPHVAHEISGNRCMCTVTKEKFDLTKEQAYWIPGVYVQHKGLKNGKIPSWLWCFAIVALIAAGGVYWFRQVGNPNPPSPKIIPTDGVTSAADCDVPMKLSPSTGTDNLDSTPSLGKLLSFTLSHGKTISIPEQISEKYKTFGIFLLNDDNGAIVNGIEHKHQKDSVKINLEILQKWIRGDGKEPVTWNTLISCLRDCGLSELADEIHQTLSPVPGLPPVQATIAGVKAWE